MTGQALRPARERLRYEIRGDWESSTIIAARAGVSPKAAGQMLAALHRGSAGVVERRQCPDTGRWEYRRVTS